MVLVEGLAVVISHEQRAVQNFQNALVVDIEMCIRDRYNTYLEEAGNGLSGGEKQRIALARAFLKDSNLYILDESTSNLDFATENLIFNMIYDQLEMCIRDSLALVGLVLIVVGLIFGVCLAEVVGIILHALQQLVVLVQLGRCV